MKQRKSDILWKVIMEEVFDDLLRFIMPDAEQEYNMERGFEFLEKELAEMYPEPEKESDTRFADKLIKVFNRQGDADWILLHIEVQGDTSKRVQFTERMFRYFYRILDKHRKPVSAVAIFTGLDGKKMPDRYTYQYRKTRVLYEYHTLSILDFTDEELKESNNPFALVVLAAKTALLEGKIPEQELLERKLLIAKELLRRGYTERKVRAIMVFLESYVLFEDPEMNRIFTEQVRSYDKSNVMNTIEYVKQEGKEEGRMEKEASVVLNLLTQTNFPDGQIADIVGVSVAFVEEVRKNKK
jgi:hypothetical protein